MLQAPAMATTGFSASSSGKVECCPGIDCRDLVRPVTGHPKKNSIDDGRAIFARTGSWRPFHARRADPQTPVVSPSSGEHHAFDFLPHAPSAQIRSIARSTAPAGSLIPAAIIEGDDSRASKLDRPWTGP